MASKQCEQGDHLNCEGCGCPCHLKPHEGHLLDVETMRRLMYTWKDQSQQLKLELERDNEAAVRQNHTIGELNRQLREVQAVLKETLLWLEFCHYPESRPEPLQKMIWGEAHQRMDAAIAQARAFLADKEQP